MEAWKTEIPFSHVLAKKKNYHRNEGEGAVGEW